MIRLLCLTIILVVLIFPCSSFGDSETEISEKELKIFLKSKEGSMTITLMQMILMRMGYFEPLVMTGEIDERTTNALFLYQKNIGLPVTGELNLNTIESLFKDSELFDSKHVILPSNSFGDNFWNTFFVASGTWAFENSNEIMEEPIQGTKITCDRSPGYCLEITAIFRGRVLDLSSEIYDIQRWDDHEIVTKPYDEKCVRYILRINRQAKTVRKIRTILNKPNICDKLNTENSDYVLSNGIEIGVEHEAKKRKQRFKLFAPELRKKLEGFSK